MNRLLHNAMSGAAGLLAMCGCSQALAQPGHDVEPLVYYTSFESPAYLAGPLMGQDEWAVSPSVTAKDAALVETKIVAEGSQAVRIDSALLKGIDTEWLRPLQYETSVNLPIVDVEWDLFLTPDKSSSNTWEFRVYGDAKTMLCSVSVNARLADTVCYWVGGLYPVQTDTRIERNAWNHFQIRLDYVAGTADFYLNGAYLNPLGLRSADVSGLRPNGTLGGVGLGVTGPGLDLACVDNISIRPSPVVCDANCDGSWVRPLLNVNDYLCFLNEYAAAQSLPVKLQINSYANFDHSVQEPILTVNDFMAYMSAYAAGCP